MKEPEWDVFSNPDPTKNTADFELYLPTHVQHTRGGIILCMRNIDIGRRRVFEAMVFHVGDADDDLDPLLMEFKVDQLAQWVFAGR
jgi:hypothetical protein